MADEIYGSRTIRVGMKGDDVAELQLRLAGFSGGAPDGDFGPGSERQLKQFQSDVMGTQNSDGIAGKQTFAAIDQFAADYPFDFSELKCKCGVCSGFGQGRFKGEFREGKPKVEAYNNYEYPGMHRMLLWAVRAAFFYYPDYQFSINSAYRCAEDNRQHNRSSTNHHGKAIDVDVPRKAGETKEDDARRCDAIRANLVVKSNAQIGWSASNKKSLEPANIAPTWVHYDVRSFASKYLQDNFFCTTLVDLDRPI